MSNKVILMTYVGILEMKKKEKKGYIVCSTYVLVNMRVFFLCLKKGVKKKDPI